MESGGYLHSLVFQFYKSCLNFKIKIYINIKYKVKKNKYNLFFIKRKLNVLVFVLTISVEPVRRKLTINDNIMGQLMEVKYLSITITSSEQRKITKANRIAG